MNLQTLNQGQSRTMHQDPDISRIKRETLTDIFITHPMISLARNTSTCFGFNPDKHS
jgi:hypothetical protein